MRTYSVSHQFYAKEISFKSGFNRSIEPFN